MQLISFQGNALVKLTKKLYTWLCLFGRRKMGLLKIISRPKDLFLLSFEFGQPQLFLPHSIILRSGGGQSGAPPQPLRVPLVRRLTHSHVFCKSIHVFFELKTIKIREDYKITLYPLAQSITNGLNLFGLQIDVVNVLSR